MGSHFNQRPGGTRLNDPRIHFAILLALSVTLISSSPSWGEPGAKGKTKGSITLDRLKEYRNKLEKQRKAAIELAFTDFQKDYPIRVAKGLKIDSPSDIAAKDPIGNILLSPPANSPIRSSDTAPGFDTPPPATNLFDLMARHYRQSVDFEGLSTGVATLGGVVRGSDKAPAGESFTQPGSYPISNERAAEPPKDSMAAKARVDDGPTGTASKVVRAPTHSNPATAAEELRNGVARVAWANGFTKNSSDALGKQVKELAEKNKLADGSEIPKLQKAPEGHIPPQGSTGEPTFKPWQLTAKDLTEKAKLFSNINKGIVDDGKKKIEEIEKDFKSKADPIDKQIADLEKEKDGGRGKGGGKGGNGQTPENKTPEEMAKNNQGTGGGSPATGGGGGTGANNSGNVTVGGGQGFSANGLNFAPTNGENTQNFQTSSFTPSGNIQNPNLGKGEKLAVSPIKKPNPFPKPPASGETAKTDSLAADIGLQLLGNGKPPGGIPAANAALSEIPQPAQNNDNGLGNTTGNKNPGGTLTDVPEPKIDFESADAIKDPEKLLQYLAANGDDSDDEEDSNNLQKAADEEGIKNRSNLFLQTVPGIEDPTGKKSILGYMGFIRKVCQDYRRGSIGVCGNSSKKPTVRAMISDSYSLPRVVAGSLAPASK